MKPFVKNTIKILHCADVHLDSPFSSLDLRRSEIRQNELRGTFTSMMLYARTQGADLVLIAGDLFESGYASKQTISIITKQFESMPDCKFVISPGNHDPYTAGSVYATCKFGENVYIFDSEELSCFTFNDLGVDVYGWGFTSPAIYKSPLVGRRSDDTGRIRLLCAHADLNSPVSRYCPLSVKDLTDFGLDYAALGHVHVTTGIDRSGDTYYGYSGCPEGRSFDEPGVGGAYFVTIQSEEGKRDIKVNRVSFSRRRYETERIDLSGVSLLEEAAARLSARINQKKYGKNTLLRAIFEGVVSPDFGGLERLSEQFDDNLFMLEVIDRTLPIFDGARLSGDMTVRGEIYRYLLPLMEEGDEREREVAALALRYGLAALDGHNITDY